MNRRNFLRNGGAATVAATVAPFHISSQPQRLPDIPTGVHSFKEDAWFLRALTVFAKYAALDKLAEHTWDYLFDKLSPSAPEKAVVESTTQTMKRNGFDDTHFDPVVLNPRCGGVLYDACNHDIRQDYCVGLTRLGTSMRSPYTALILDGPAMGMIAFVAQDAAKNGYSTRDVRSLLFPSGQIHSQSTGCLKRGYSKPLVYDTLEGYRVAVDYKVNNGIGQGEIAVADIDTETMLTQKMFEFQA